MIKKISVWFLLLIIGVFLTGCQSKSDSLDNLTVNSSPVVTIKSDRPVKINNRQTSSKGGELERETDMATSAALLSAQQAVIKTSRGQIVINLLVNEAPKTIDNFLRKSRQGFYRGLTFHRVEDWVVQGGDPLGNGTGGGRMLTELNRVPFKAGSVGVARGQDIRWSNDAQFFICKTDCDWLTGQYTNFGQVVRGMEVVKQLEIGDKIIDISYQ